MKDFYFLHRLFDVDDTIFPRDNRRISIFAVDMSKYTFNKIKEIVAESFPYDDIELIEKLDNFQHQDKGFSFFLLVIKPKGDSV